MLHRNSVRMTKPEMEKIVRDYALESYHVNAYRDGSYELLWGDSDPMNLLQQAQLEIETMKVQIRYLMTKAYGIDYTKAEELVK